MRTSRLRDAIPCLCISLVCSTAPLTAGTYTVLKTFGLGNYAGGSDLYAGLTLDGAGNVYGAAETAGAYGFGTVFELSPGSGAQWKQTVIYNFKGGPADGATPHASLVWDANHNLYGTTVQGGPASPGCNGGCGIVFKLTQSGNQWTETVLHGFTGGPDGSTPYAGVVIDSAGNIYGCTAGGGASGHGTVYRLAPNGAGGWTETVLYSFKGNSDGEDAYGGLTLDGNGNIYGTTYSGGGANSGTAFELVRSGPGTWTKKTLYEFKGGNDGVNPSAPLVFDRAGNLYGTTTLGGKAGCGTAFKLTRAAGGAWTESVIYTFLGVTADDPENPNGLVFDSHGNLFGSSVGGGIDNPGTIFELSPAANGSWKETVLFSCTNVEQGFYPSSTLSIDSAGNLYGTTLWGGPGGDTTGGVAFRFTP